MHQMAAENAALDTITMEEFLETEAMTGNLKDKSTGKVSFPPYNRTDWNGLLGKEYDELREWLRNVTLVPQWKPDKCLAAFPANGNHKSVEELQQMQRTIHTQGGVSPENYRGKPVPVDGPPIDRMKENLFGRSELCVYDEAMQNEFVIHFVCAHKLRLRLLVHFYAFLFMEDWKEDLWLKRFMRDHMRYNDDIQCAAARLVHAMRQKARENDPKGNPDGIFDSMVSTVVYLEKGLSRQHVAKHLSDLNSFVYSSKTSTYVEGTFNTRTPESALKRYSSTQKIN